MNLQDMLEAELNKLHSCKEKCTVCRDDARILSKVAQKWVRQPEVIATLAKNLAGMLPDQEWPSTEDLRHRGTDMISAQYIGTWNEEARGATSFLANLMRTRK